MKDKKWELICEERGAQVRCLEIPGGRLYQVQTGSKLVDRHLEYYEPIFGETTFVPTQIPKAWSR